LLRSDLLWLAPGYYILDATEGVALRRVDGHTVYVRSSLPRDVLRELLHALDGTRSIPELAAQYEVTAEIIGRTVEELYRVGVLTNGVPPTPLAMFLTHVLRSSADKAYEAITNGQVTVVGGSVLGHELVRVLALDGVGRIRWIDVDSQGASASEAFEEGERCAKIEILRGDTSVLEALLEQGSAQELLVAAHEDPQTLVDESVNRFAVSRGLRCLRLDISGADIILGPTVLPGQTACWACLRERRLGHVADPAVLQAFEQYLMETPRRHPFGYSWSLLVLAAGLAASEVLRLLIEPFCERPVLLPQTYGTQIVLSPLRGEWQSHHVLRLPRCRVCGHARLEDSRKAPWAAIDVIAP
jgi:ribosomal protein S12 methylthiotransferase accessory factor